MTEKNRERDDIPSLDSLQIDWGYEAKKPQEKRNLARMSAKYVSSLFKTENIQVRVVTETLNLDGFLNDISSGGISIILKEQLAVNEFVKIGFFLKKQKILSGAIVKHSAQIKEGYTIRFQFQNIKEEYSQYINGLYSAKILNR